MQSLLSIRRISKLFAAGVTGCRARVVALANTSLDVSAGELLSVEGPGGSGKSTLLLCASALITPDVGSVLWRGAPARAARVGSLVGYVTSAIGRHVFVTAEEALLYRAMQYDVWGGRARLAEPCELIAALDLRASLRTPVDALERRERYRVAVAESLLLGASVLALDAPPDDAVLAVALNALRPRGLAVLAADASDQIRFFATRSVQLARCHAVHSVASSAVDRVAERERARDRVRVAAIRQ